jgi:hypothetical protein
MKMTMKMTIKSINAKTVCPNPPFTLPFPPFT